MKNQFPKRMVVLLVDIFSGNFLSRLPTVLLLACQLAFLAGPADAAPRRPSDDAEVLERLPLRPGDPVARELADLRRAWRAQPQDAEAAVALARRYYTLVGQEGDPRYLGYAQAALAPWWNLAAPPVEVQVLRAGLRQFTHDFDGAVADLDAVLQRQPGHAGALALRATIAIVQARYAAARSDCRALSANWGPLLSTACTAMVDGLTGQAGPAYSRLRDALQAHPGALPGEKLWALLRLAEIARRLGDTEVAELHFRQALALNIEDSFLLAAYADLLLDLDRPAEVLRLLKDRQASDGLLLRLVLAERQLGAPQAQARTLSLSARYAASRLRGDTVHEQEEARFMLATGQDPRQALRLASHNWTLQREPRDARVLLEAALAARDTAAAQPVLQWLQANRVQDVVLHDLARQLQELPR